MNSKKRTVIMIVSVVLLCSVLLTTAAVAALSGDGRNNATEKNGIVKYEKPSVGGIAQDGAYPNEIESNSSANAQAKEWYEYITYSKIPIGEVQEGSKKVVFYDPYDYDYGMIMEITNPKSEFGEYDDPEGYTTANEITVSYSATKSHSWTSSLSIDLGFEESLESKVEATVGVSYLGSAEASSTVGASVGFKFSQNIGVSHMQADSEDSSASKNVTYNAMYFNAHGTPYRWRIVKYAVYLPIRCEVQTLVGSEWVVTDETYCLLTTVQGTCREWINEVAYVEDWRTGEAMQVENFWKEFFSKETLLDAYKKKMIPKS